MLVFVCFLLLVVNLIAGTGAVDCPERLVSEMTYLVKWDVRLCWIYLVFMIGTTKLGFSAVVMLLSTNLAQEIVRMTYGCILTTVRTSSQSPASINEDDIPLPPEPPGNCSKRLQVDTIQFLKQLKFLTNAVTKIAKRFVSQYYFIAHPAEVIISWHTWRLHFFGLVFRSVFWSVQNSDWVQS